MTGSVRLFGSTLFLGSFLMFLVEPMVTRMVLPQLGGGPMVWSTCLVFFQASLLVGYACAHGAVRLFGTRRSVLVYGLLLLLPWVVLPTSISTTPVTTSNPALWLLLTLAGSIGLPFLVLSMAAPSLQRWFAATPDPSGRDPFFLYAASNFGSLLALISYPTVVEPLFSLHTQTRLWEGAYGAFVVLATWCGVAAWTKGGDQAEEASDAVAAPPAGWGRRFEWLALSAVPSSLLLGVTTYISTDIAAVPLLWVVPLSLYLLTFVLAFSQSTRAWGVVASRRLPLLSTALIVFIAGGFGLPIWLLVPMHLIVFAGAALMCHARLAATRPAPRRLTEFYLWIAVGGLVGGMFNALVAPLLFNSTAEYPLALVTACGLRLLGSQQADDRLRDRLTDLLAPLAIGALAVALVLLRQQLGASERLLGVAFGLPGVLAFGQSRRPLRFALSLGAILLAAMSRPDAYGRTLYTERTFFGIYHISTDSSGRFHSLYHGTTLHGLQALDRARQSTPLMYYHPSGPIGQAFMYLPQVARASSVAVVGLGVGSLSSYSREGQRWTFYEVDPAVERIARDGRYFTHLESCGARCRVVIGDARLSLRASEDRYDLIVLDAFSSDAIPIHLLTREAVMLYLSRLAHGGALAFHISNRHLALGPVLAGISRNLGLTAIEQMHAVTPAESDAGQSASDWVLISRDDAVLEPLMSVAGWNRLATSSMPRLWTDDFSNILTVLKVR